MNPYLKKYLPPIIGGYYNLLSPLFPKYVGKQAFYTFCTIRKGRILPNQESFLDQAKKERLQAGEHEVQLYEWPGTGDTVLLLHGWESNSYRWRNLIEVLQRYDFRIIAFDAPGHGYSNGKILNVVIYSKCANKAIEKFRPSLIIGHSMGGMTALYTLAQNAHPGVKKVVTLGSPNKFSEIVDDYQRIMGFNSRVYKALDDYIHFRYGFRIRDFNSANFAKKLPQNGLLIHDQKDRIIPVHTSRQVHQAWPKSRLMETEGLGHSLHQEAVNRTIADFLKS